jgi:hypothetical protein
MQVPVHGGIHVCEVGRIVARHEIGAADGLRAWYRARFGLQLEPPWRKRSQFFCRTNRNPRLRPAPVRDGASTEMKSHFPFLDQAVRV